MRRLIYGINITLDGCCDHTKMNGSEELHDYYATLLAGAGVLLYGRKTYQLMVPFWPDMAKNKSGDTDSMNAFARAFDAVDQIVVFSKTLEQPLGGKTRVLRDNLREEILLLKQQEGKDILLGGVAFPSQLIALNLVDEYHILVQPIVAGAGRRLLSELNLPENIPLQFLDSIVFKSGSVLLRYSRL